MRFTSFYILPSIFNTDLDRGFSLIDYGLNRLLSSPEDLDDLRAMDMDLAPGFHPESCLRTVQGISGHSEKRRPFPLPGFLY